MTKSERTALVTGSTSGIGLGIARRLAADGYNTIAPFRLVAEAEPHLRASAAQRRRPAAVVNIASHAGVRPKGASIPYAASKAALVHTTKLLSLTLAPDIRVNAGLGLT